MLELHPDLQLPPGGSPVERRARAAMARSARVFASHETTGRMPRWQGAPTIQTAYEACYQGSVVEWILAPTAVDSSDGVLSPAGMAYIHGERNLREARPIVVPIDQQQALPRLKLSELVPWATSLRLPFPAIYLDLTSPEGVMPRVGARSKRASDAQVKYSTGIAGAICWEGRSEDDDTGHDQAKDEVVTINILALTGVPTPPRDLSAPQLSQGGGDLEIGAHIMIDRSGDLVLPGSEYVADFHGVPVRQYGMGFFYDVPEGAPGALAPTWYAEHAGPHSTGVLQVATPACSYDLARLDVERRIAGERHLALLSAGVAEYILGILYFVDSHNVEIVDAAIHRRERKRAEKRRWPIASTVTVRRRRVSARPSAHAPSTSGAGVREYSHQFEVEGHYNHVRRGPHVRCATCAGEGKRVAPEITLRCKRCGGTGLDPELVKACTRRDQHGEPTCPGGCRREWVPSYIKGPADAVLVPKSRVMHFSDT